MKKDKKKLLGIILAAIMFLTNIGNFTVFAIETDDTLPLQESVELQLVEGEGSGKLYYDFKEKDLSNVKEGDVYAFLDRAYGQEEALTALGSGAVLEISGKNNSYKYIKGWYGDDAEVETYVKVIQRGQGFDGCPEGGLYKVPKTSAPIEYRYFCYASGAKNAGPLHAYDYKTADFNHENITVTLSAAENTGSLKSADYNIKVEVAGLELTLDPASYKVSKTAEDDILLFTIQNTDGSTIKAKYRTLLSVKYDGNGATTSSDMQALWKGKKVILRDKPTREGYQFLNWLETKTKKTYTAGQTITSLQKNLALQAQWKDIAAPKITYNPVYVAARTEGATVQELFKDALIVTDNEPVEECTIQYEVPLDIAKSSGAKYVKVTVTDKAGNKAEKNCLIQVNALPLKLEKPVFNEATQVFTSKLTDAGSEKITETGIVWGVMGNPTTMVNNGKVTTNPTVTATDGDITVQGSNIAKGITYYARAYAIAGGITYYSEEVTFGYGLPNYGTFTISGPGSTSGSTTVNFKISRTGDEGEQTVHYRTINGSAVGGIHFTHKAGTITFKDGEKSKTVSVAVKTANEKSNSKDSTKYTNADRVFSMEIYYVTGGATLGNTKVANCTLTKSSSYQINRNIYTTEKAKAHTVTDGKNGVVDNADCSNGDLFWKSNRTGKYATYIKDNNNNNYNNSRTLSDNYTSNEAEYIYNTTTHWLYRYKMTAYEEEDGWEHAWMGLQKPNSAGTGNKFYTKGTSGPIPIDQDGAAIWTGRFQIKEGETSNLYYPSNEENNKETYGDIHYVKDYEYRTGYYKGNGDEDYALIPIANKTVYNYFTSCGADYDLWRVTAFTDYTKIYDTKEPQILGFGTTASGTIYRAGDEFTVSVIFDEIVDSTNSSNIKQVSLETTWGTATYAGGINTNVLYFKGTVKGGATGELQVSSVSNTAQIKDMCSDAPSNTATSSKTGSTGGTANTSLPNFTLTSKGVSSGVGTIELKVNETKDYTSAVQYVWTDSSAMPVSGWMNVEAADLAQAKRSSKAYSIRKEGGSGANNGKWYLHMIATNQENFATTYAYEMVDFGTKGSPINSAPTMSVSTDNSYWAESRTIHVTKKGSNAVYYRPSWETTWTQVSSSNFVTVKKNGNYIFRMSAGDQDIIKNILVEKIDTENPVVQIGELKKADSVETSKENVYTKIMVPVRATDAESAVTLKYAWTTSATAPTGSTSWTTIPANTEQLSYTANQTSETKIYLHLRATDEMNHVTTVKSEAYKVISQNTVDNYTPIVSMTGGTPKWTNDMQTITWELSNYKGKDYEVLLPNGDVTTESTGNFLATANGTYTITVRDKEFGGSNTDSVTIDKLDLTNPTVKVEGIAKDWTNSAQTVKLTFSDTQSGIESGYYKVVSSKEGIPTTGLTEISGNSVQVPITESGTWYVYYKATDNTGDSTLQRPANITEGFTSAIRVDKTAPTGKLSIGQNSWEEFWNTIGFGLFFKDTNKVVVEAKDTHSGMDKMEYYLSDKELTETQVRAVSTWTAFDKEFPIEPVHKYVVYVKISDKVGNATVLNTEGVVLYKDANQDTKSITYTKTTTADIQAKVVLNGNTIQKIENNGNLISAANYTVAADGTIRFRATYLDTLKEGDYTLTISYNPLGETYVEKADNQEPTTTAIELTVKKHVGLVTDIQNINKVYDGTGATKPTYKSSSTGVATFAYKVKDADNSTYTDIAPKNVGEYTVRVTVAADENYLEASAEKDFEITAKEIGLDWTTPTNLEFDGTEKKPTVKATGIVSGDTVKVTAELTAGKDNVNVGNFTFTAKSVDNKNYKLPEQVVSDSYSITPRPLVKADFTVDTTDKVYKAQEIHPSVESKNSLVTAKDYEVTYSDNVNAGKATITIKGKGNAEGTVAYNFDITKATPSVTWPTNISGNAGEKVDTIDLSAYSTANGKFIWKIGDTTIAYGKNECAITYIPNDTTNYKTVEDVVEVEGKDVIAPTGKISIDTNDWNSFLNDITFGVFFKKTQTVTITAVDDEYGSGIEKIAYYHTTEKVDNIKALDDNVWTEGEKFDIEPENKYIIYVRITDKAGNVTYLSTEGIVIFKDTEVVTGEYDYTLTTKTDIVTNIKPGKNTVDMIDLCEPGGNAGDMLDYTINAEGYLVLDGEDIESVAKDFYAGDYKITITYKALDEAYVEGTSKGDKITDTVLTLHVKRCPVKKPSADNRVFTYNGSEQTYHIPANDAYEVTNNKRTDVGNQEVVVALTDTNTYEWADGTTDDLKFNYSIGKATFIADVKQNGALTYNGSEQTASVKTTENNIQGNQAVTYKYGTKAENCSSTDIPAFKNANTYTVYFVASADNHNDAKGSFEVTIDKKEIGIDWSAPSNLIFDGTAKKPTATAIGLTGSDTVQIIVTLNSGSNINAGSFTYKATDIDNNNYKLPANVTSESYTILPRVLMKEDFQAVISGLIYTGSAIEPNVASINPFVTSNDYIVAYENNVNAGEDNAKIKITGKNNVCGTVEIKFSIARATPEINFPTGLNIGTDKKLSDIVLPNGYTWDVPDTAVGYDLHEYPMTFTPEDTDNYNIVKANVGVTGNDVTVPTGKMEIAEHSWNTFWSGVTFGLFFNNTQTINVTSGDTESGVAKTEYFLSDKELSEKEAKEVIGWTVFNDSFNINPNNKYVVYVKITDHVGNAVIINSDGVVLDDILPVLSGIEDGKTYYQEVEVTVTDTNLDKVEINGEKVTITDGKFKLTAKDEVQKVKAFDKAGNVSAKITITVEAQHNFVWGEWYDNNDDMHSKDAQCVCGADLKITAPMKENVVVDGLEEESVSQEKDLKLIVETDIEKIDNEAMEEIQRELSEGITAEYVDIIIKDVIGDVAITDTTRVLEIPVAFDFTDKLNITVYRNHGGEVHVLKELETRPNENLEDGSYYLDCENGIIYIYSNQFSTYGVAYHKHELIHVPQKDATKEADGNIEYWYCEYCDKYFKDVEGKKEISKADTIVKYVASPITGDFSNAWLWILCCGISMSIMTVKGVLTYKRNKKRIRAR